MNIWNNVCCMLIFFFVVIFSEFLIFFSIFGFFCFHTALICEQMGSFLEKKVWCGGQRGFQQLIQWITVWKNEKFTFIIEMIFRVNNCFGKNVDFTTFLSKNKTWRWISEKSAQWENGMYSLRWKVLKMTLFSLRWYRGNRPHPG